MSSVPKTITIDGVEFVQKSDNQKPAETLDGLKYVLIRADRAGVFVGYLKEEQGSTVVLLQARRIFYWSGAATLSQLAIDGTKKPKDCKFPEAVNKIKILGVIEIIEVTEKAKKSIDGVLVWKQ